MNPQADDMQLLQTFAKPADTLVETHDIVDLVQVLIDSCSDLIDVSAWGILLADEWDGYPAKTLAEGLHSLYAIPMRLRETTIGTVNMIRTEPDVWSEADAVAARAFADVATIGIAHARSLERTDEIRKLLLVALNSPITIEQAEWVIAQTREVDMDEAFELIRSRARAEQPSVAVVVARIVDRSVLL